MRHARVGREALDGACEDAESGNLRSLRNCARTAPADRGRYRERHARADAFGQGRPDAHLVERSHQLSEVADAGEDDLRRVLQTLAVAHERVLRADRVERVLHGAQIAGAVVENRNHMSRPLVDGSWSFNRSSVEQAYFSARAKHLKIASIL